MEHLEREDRRAERRAEEHGEPGGHPRDREDTSLAAPTSRIRRPTHDARLPVVCTNGASGPIAPPDAMQTHEIGISERSVRMPVAEPDTWMLSTMSSTSPGLPTQRVTSAANRPAPPSTTNPIAPLHSVGQRTCWSRCRTSR